MTMENEDVFPIEHGDFPASHVSFRGVAGSANLMILWMTNRIFIPMEFM